MATLTFEIESEEVDKVKTILKALGARKLKVTHNNPVSPGFEEKLLNSEKGKGTKLATEQEVSDFFQSI